MKYVISDSKVREFRDLVNSNSSFVYQIYKDKEGKNLYNLVCSCMDWISVSVRHLENASEFDENIDTKSMQVYSLISSIDLISESITQLHRVFIDERTVPFRGEKKCFSNRLFPNEDDDTYFKTIRACFGAHPVALNQSNSKRFASWPFDSHRNSGDLSVYLYSRDVNEDDLLLNLSINELLDFLVTRYEYLDVIGGKINSLFIDYQNKLANQLIETKSDPLEQLYVLKLESERRLDNDYYNSEINDLIMIFEAEVTDPQLVKMANDFRGNLLPLIDEIRENLQAMKIVDLVKDPMHKVKSNLSERLSYELPKFYSWVYHGRYDPLLNYYFERFNSVTGGKYNFSDTDEVNLSFLKSRLMLIE